MIGEFWFQFLYQPLFNALILIYNTIAEQNLGWAVVWLTVFLRLILLPLSIISEKNSLKQGEVEKKAEEMANAFRGDPVMMKEEYRNFMRKNKMSPWAKVIVLAVQILVLFLLYQVFMQGITGERVIRVLYPWVDFPGSINILFYGFNIGEVHSGFWAFISAAFLFLVILFEHGVRTPWKTQEATYLFVFPLATYLVLWYLPMVKSLFILTTMVFSVIIGLVSKVVLSQIKTKESQ